MSYAIVISNTDYYNVANIGYIGCISIHFDLHRCGVSAIYK